MNARTTIEYSISVINRKHKRRIRVEVVMMSTMMPLLSLSCSSSIMSWDASPSHNECGWGERLTDMTSEGERKILTSQGGWKRDWKRWSRWGRRGHRKLTLSSLFAGIFVESNLTICLLHCLSDLTRMRKIWEKMVVCEEGCSSLTAYSSRVFFSFIDSLSQSHSQITFRALGWDSRESNRKEERSWEWKSSKERMGLPSSSFLSLLTQFSWAESEKEA